MTTIKVYPSTGGYYVVIRPIEPTLGSVKDFFWIIKNGIKLPYDQFCKVVHRNSSKFKTEREAIKMVKSLYKVKRIYPKDEYRNDIVFMVI